MGVHVHAAACLPLTRRPLLPRTSAVESAADLRPSRSRGARDALVLVTAHMHDSVPASVLAGLARGGSELSIMSSASTAKAAGAAEARAAAALDGVPGVGAQAFRWSSKVAKKSNEPHWAEETVMCAPAARRRVCQPCDR